MSENASQFSSPEDLLAHTSSEFSRLKTESIRAIENGDALVYRSKLVQSAEIISTLPAKIVELVKNGSRFDPEKMLRLRDFAGVADIALKEYEKDGNTFRLGVLLTPQGSKEGDPNLLEKLVQELTVSSNAESQTISGLLRPDTKREECVQIVKGLLTPDEVKSLGGEDAADKMVESISYLGAFAPAPATFDETAFRFTAGSDLSDEDAKKVWEICNRIGVLKDESAAGEGRVSVSKDLVDMLKDTKNGYLTED